MSNYLLTASLLGAWKWFLGNAENDPEAENAKFLQTLRREPFEQNEAMKAGNEFEADVYQYLRAPQMIVHDAADRDYWACVVEVGEYIRGGSFQVKDKRLLTVAGRTYLMYGRIDALKADTIYDIKFTRSEYEIGKYATSAQHPMYFYIVPDVPKFSYLTSNGKHVWTEEYRREDCTSIQAEAADFESWLSQFPEFRAIYDEKWKSF